MSVKFSIKAFCPARAEFLALAALVMFGWGVFSASAADKPAAISKEILAVVFPRADRVEPFSGQPPAAAAYRNNELVGYLFSTLVTVGTVGYSGKPIDVVAGIDLDAVITGAFLLKHNEPILVIGVSHQDLTNYVGGFTGIPLGVRVEEKEATAPGFPDAIAGATVSSAVIRDGIVRAGRVVARSRGLLGGSPTGVRLDRETFASAGWDDLVGDGSIVNRRISQGDVVAAFEASGVDLSLENPDAVFIDLYVGLVSPPRIGQNLLGKAAFNRLAIGMEIEDQAIFIAANGLYSFKGTGFIRSGRFDRVQIVQDEKTIPLTKARYQNVEAFRADGAPELRETGVFVIPGDSGFDPLKPWRVDLLVSGDGPEGKPVQRFFSIDYSLPEQYRLGTPETAAEEEAAGTATPLWQEIWKERWGRIVVVLLILAVLSAILVFQDSLASTPRLQRRIRLGFLTVTLLWIGWYAGGQLSVVNVLTFSHSLMGDFQWEFFLLDPVIFLLWSYVAVTLLFWGRGVFCGWLCPFGALQGLLSEGARMLKVPQVNIPFALHERLWPIKYMIFLGLFAVSLHSTSIAFQGAEVEPFKTAISLKFMRHWPFVLYAVLLLVAGLFIERFFCRYLCPLGAALAIPARIRMFEWLKRRPQCGRECGVCAQRCPVQAIHPSGAINPNECIYCLGCQKLYFDDAICPPLTALRNRRERRQALAAGHAVNAEQP